MAKKKPKNNVLRRDPSRTAGLRAGMIRDIRRRYRKIAQAITSLIVGQDMLGIKPPGSVLFNKGVENTRWQFLSDVDKVKSYRKWLTEQVDASVLESDSNEPWHDTYIRDAHSKGRIRAYVDSKKAFADFEESSTLLGSSREQFLQDSFGVQTSTKTLQGLYTRTFDSLENITNQMGTEMSRTLATGLARGDGATKIARDLRKSVGLSRMRAERIARTEIVAAHAEGQLDSFEQLGIDDLDVLSEWATAGDEKVCPLCEALNGVTLTVKEARGMLPRHPNCVTGNMVIEANSTAVMSAKYTGQIIELGTTGDTPLTVTANHIMLTQRGWVFAKDITNSDYLVRSPNSQFDWASPNDNSAKPCISDVFATLTKVVDPCDISQTLAMPEYLHGDGEFIDSEIDIVSTDGILWNQLQPEVASVLKESLFYMGDVRPFHPKALQGCRSLSEFLQRCGSATDSLMRLAGVTDILQARATTHHCPVSNGVVSDGDTNGNQVVGNSTSAKTKPIAELIGTDPVGVEFNNLISQFLVPVKYAKSTHVDNLPVYDVSTVESLYSVNGVVTSNCRCAWIPASRHFTTKASPILDRKTGKLVRRGQIRSKEGIRDALDASLRAERPGKSLKDAKRDSRWVGADSRPTGKSRGTTDLTKLIDEARPASARAPLGSAATKPKPKKRKDKKSKTKTVTKAPKKKTVSRVQPPEGVTYSGEKTKFTDSVWSAGNEARDNIRNPVKMVEVGTIIREEADKDPRIASLKRQFNAAEKESIRVEKLFPGKTVMDTPERFASEWELIKTRDAYYKELQAETLSQVKKTRDFGKSNLTLAPGSAQTRAMKAAATNLPDDWTEAINEKLEIQTKKNTRGYFAPNRFVPPKAPEKAPVRIRVSGNTKAEIKATATHELVHAREFVSEDSRFQVSQDAFLRHRQKGEKQTFTRRYNNKGKIEVFYDTNLPDPYIGREYDPVPAFYKEGTFVHKEVISAGMSNLVDPENRYRTALQKDTEYFDYLLGALATL